MKIDWIFIFIWALWVVMAAVSVLQTRKLMCRFAREAPRQPDQPFDMAWVIMPCKGLDVDLPGCIRSLCAQTYPAAWYQLVFVVESAEDPAHAVLVRETAGQAQLRARILIAGQTAGNQSQKVHNQLFALRHVMPLAGERDVLVFADSDAVPGAHWLLELVHPAKEPKNGMVTGYRWLIPEPDPAGGGISLWSHLASIMNSSIACIYRNKLTSRAWGGGMAMKVAVAREGGLEERLAGALTDDYQFTQLCRDLDRRVWFAPRCLVPTPEHFTWKTLLNFAYRQYVITRVYEPWTFRLGLLVLLFWVIGFFSAWGVLAQGVLRGRPLLEWLGAALAIVLVAGLNQLRSYYRRKVVQAAFQPAIVAQLQTTLRLDQWLTPVWMTFHCLLMGMACFGRTLRWRGMTYVLRGPQDVRRID